MYMAKKMHRRLERMKAYSFPKIIIVISDGSISQSVGADKYTDTQQVSWMWH